MAEGEEKDKAHLDGLKFKELTSVWGPVEAEVIKSFLESQGIPCIQKGRIGHDIYPFSMNGLGEIRIFVPEKDYETARKLLESKPQEVPD